MGAQFEIIAPWMPILKNAILYELETSPFISFQFSNIETINTRNEKNEEIKISIPRLRTVVHRGFLFDNSNTNVILFTTDRRSNKYRQLLENPNYEACYWFSKSNIQLRLNGTIKVITSDSTPNLQLIKNLNHIAYTNDGKPFYNATTMDPTTSNLSTMTNQNFNTADPSASSISLATNPLDLEEPILDQLEKKFPTHNYSIDDPINFKIVSPEQLKKLDQSSTSLFQLGQQKPEEMIPPTKEEWLKERERVFQSLSRSIKKSFFKPQPGTLLTDDKATLLDSIKRGVDGLNYNNLKEIDNFVVVCMFVNFVDLVNFNDDRRIIYKRFDNGAWKEFEVCP